MVKVPVVPRSSAPAGAKSLPTPAEPECKIKLYSTLMFQAQAAKIKPGDLEFDALVASIEKCGMINAICVTKRGRVIDGKRRVAAAIKAGLQMIPVHVKG
jgi:hypothetical protein